jgi:formate-dependent nitrite reductase membrane component NrfD
MTLLQSPHWPVLIDVYFFLGGLAGGAFVIATVANLLDAQRYRSVIRTGYYLATAVLIPCPIILIVDLGVPARFMNMVLYFNPTSPMSMGAWALLGFSACAGLATLLTLMEDFSRARDLSRLKSLVGVIGGFFGFFLAAYPGVLIGATVRPLWVNSHALGALFLTVGASTAAAAMALILVVVSRRSADGVASLRIMTVLALVLQLVSLAIVVVSINTSGSPSSAQALAELMSGRFSTLFWLGVGGSILPLVIGLVDLKLRSAGLTAIASLLVIAGGFLLKYVVMAAGQAWAAFHPCPARGRFDRPRAGDVRSSPDDDVPAARPSRGVERSADAPCLAGRSPHAVRRDRRALGELREPGHAPRVEGGSLPEPVGSRRAAPFRNARRAPVRRAGDPARRRDGRRRCRE